MPARRPVAWFSPRPPRELRYANCWEDAHVLVEALGPLEGARCLSIASGGDNTLSLLARGAEHVLALDVSATQLALLELKATAIAWLEPPEVVAFLGATAPPRPGGPQARARLGVYARLAPRLSPRTRAVWDAHPRALAAGVLHAGRLERYFQLFRRAVLPLVHGRATVRALLQPRPAAAQRRFYDEVWDTPRWRALFALFFGRRVMSLLGREPEFFRHVTGDVAATVLARTRRALREGRTHDNPYLVYLLTGAFGSALPDYLQAPCQAALRPRLKRLELRQAALAESALALPPASVDAFNLSNVGEYVGSEVFADWLETLLVAAAPGARFAYWNLFVPRSAAGRARLRLSPRREALEWSRRAQAFFYARLVAEVAP